MPICWDIDQPTPMHIPFFSSSQARLRWNQGLPDLDSPQELLDAHKDATYWADELRAGNMRAMDESYYLERFRALGFVHHHDFWNALIGHLGKESPSFWLPALDSAITTGNVQALTALNTAAGFSKQALFYQWRAFVAAAANPEPLHANTLAWFAGDESLHDFLEAYSASALSRLYSNPMLRGDAPWFVDPASQSLGVNAVLAWTNAWCALPDSLANPNTGLRNALDLLVELNRRDQDRQGQDPGGVNRRSPSSVALSKVLEQSVELICERTKMPPGLVRTLAGRMTQEDLEQPFLCAVAQFEYADTASHHISVLQQRNYMHPAHWMQIQNNAKFAEPLPLMLDMQTQRGQSWQIYNLAEPFINKRAIQVEALPTNFLDAPLSE